MAQTDRTTGLVGNAGMKLPVRAASTVALVLSGLQTVDGVVLAQDDRVLVKDQASSVDNGVYMADSGAWERAKDWDGPYDIVNGSLVYVTDGTLNLGLWMIDTDDPITVGTTAVLIRRARLQQEMLPVACSDETSILTVGTKTVFRMPYAMGLTSVKASLTTAQTAGTIFTVDILKNGVSILSTKITIDNNEKTSVTAVTPPVLSNTSLAADDEISIAITQIGNGTATGLKAYLIGLQPGS
jgi:phage-related tail fiber protein